VRGARSPWLPAGTIRSTIAGLVNLPARSRDVEIAYTALSFAVPEKVRFRYRLEGRDQVWSGAGTRRRAFYSDLPPGQYRFQVTAANNDGVWNEQGAMLTFVIAPAYYQTAWFRAMVLVAGLSILWALHRIRLRRLAHEFDGRLQERVAERTRIARELHDTLLQSFQGLMLRFQVVDDLLPAGKAKHQLGQALERADQAIAEGRDAVCDLRGSAVATDDLARAVRALGEELATPDSATFHLVVEGAARDLNPILRDDVYCITREALRNAFRHARARRIETEIVYGVQAFRVRVRDDGEGIHQRTLDEGRAGHYGLRGMRERAKAVAGTLDIWSGPGSGTEIDLSIAGATAYGSSTHPRWLGVFRKSRVT
jgi:signal transduction histidine kinase